MLTLSRVVPRISLISCWVTDNITLFLSDAAAFYRGLPKAGLPEGLNRAALRGDLAGARIERDPAERDLPTLRVDAH